MSGVVCGCEVSLLDQERRMKLVNCNFVESGKWFPPTWNHRSAHIWQK